MASLTGNQINNSYQGLLKTESNGALGTGLTNLTDGVGNSTGLSLNDSANEFMYTHGNVEYSMKNTNFTRTAYPMSGTAGDASYLNFKDNAGQYVGWLSLDRYGSMYYTNTHGDNGESHVFVSQTGTGLYAPAVIRIDTYNSVNNSDNWYTAYNERITAGSYDGGTQNLTLTKPNGTDIVVNIPAGGGTPGLINGIGANSLTNDPSLVTTAPTTGGTFSLILGDAAGGATTGIVALGAGAGQQNLSLTNNWSSVAVGQNAKFNSFGAVSIGPASVAGGSSSIAIGDSADALDAESTAIAKNARCNSTNSISIGRDTTTNNRYDLALIAESTASGNYAIAMSRNATATGEGTISVGYNSQALGANNHSFGRENKIQAGSENTILGGRNNIIPNGINNTLIGNSYITFPSGQNDNVAVGRITGIGAGTSNSVAIGLVAQVGDAAGDSVAIGRSATIANGATNGVAVGNGASVSVANGTAVGYNAAATTTGYTAVRMLEINDYATLNFADDTAAAAGGVPLGGVYHNAGALRIRIV